MKIVVGLSEVETDSLVVRTGSALAITKRGNRAFLTVPSGSGGGGGGGSWTASGYTGTASRFAIFDGSGGAAYLSYPSAGIVAWDGAGAGFEHVTVDAPLSYTGAHLSIDLSAYLTAASASTVYLSIAAASAAYQPLDDDLSDLAGLDDGLPFRSSGAWAAYSLGDLTISGASVQVTQARGLRESGGATLAMGSVADGDALVRSGATIVGASVAAGPTGVTASGVYWGDGSNGDYTFDGTSAVTGWSRSGSTYTWSGTTAINAKTVQFSANNITLVLGGYQLRCRSYNPDARDYIKVIANGNPGSGVTAGSGAAPAALWNSSGGGAQFYGGHGGGAGVSGDANGSNGGTMLTGAICNGGTGGRGGRARATGISTIRTGGNGGGSTANNAFNYYGHPRIVTPAVQPFHTAGTAIAQIGGGTGGGGGGVGAAGSSGGGGGGGGVLCVCAAVAKFGVGCTFEAVGGPGAAAVVTGINEGGGGGGGGGGEVTVIIGRIDGSNLPSCLADGGVGGAASGNSGAWAEGGNGGNGGKAYLTVGTNNVGGTPTLSAAGGLGGANAGSNQTSGALFVGSVAGTTGTTQYTEA